VPEKQTGSAADQVRAVLEAAEQVRAQAQAEAERTRGAVGRVEERAEQLSRRLDELAAAVTEAVAALRAELEELREDAEQPPLEAPAAESVAEDDTLIAEAEAAAARPPEVEEAKPAPQQAPAAAVPEGARLLALKMALDGRPREETAAYLSENFELDDPEALLDEVYARVGN
jgi:uncharacterized phage infection (PIP) family protein YhgE